MPFRKSSTPIGRRLEFDNSVSSVNPNDRGDAAGTLSGKRKDTTVPRLSDMVRFHTKQELIASGDGKWKTNCPTVDHEDKHPSFEINDNLGHHGAYNCWGCAAHGGGEKFAREIMRTDSWQAAVDKYVEEKGNAVAKRGPANTGAPPPSTTASARRAVNLRNRTAAASPLIVSEEDQLYKMSIRHDLQTKMEIASRLFQDSLLNDKIIDGMSKYPLNKEAKEYLVSRELWQPDPAFRVGYFPAASYVGYLDHKDIFRKNSINASAGSFSEFSYLKNRIIFPWCDENGEVVGLTGRSIGIPREGTPKYWNSRNTEIFKKSELLWGHHIAKDAIRKTGELLIVEGYTDVMSLHKAGVKQTVSPIGIAISRPQLEKIFNLTDHALVCLDGDRAGRKASVDVAKHTLAYLNETGLAEKGKSMSFALLSGGKDPDEIVREGGVSAFREAIRKPIGLREMIAYGETLNRQKPVLHVGIGGTAATNETVSQIAEHTCKTAIKRSAPDGQEQMYRERKRQRCSSDRDI